MLFYLKSFLFKYQKFYEITLFKYFLHHLSLVIAKKE